MAERAGDHFSSVSHAYSAFRPRYPSELFDYVESIVDRHQLAWDCGAGSGQASGDLAARFDAVVATDLSVAQLREATRHERIVWAAARAEAAPIAGRSIDLIAVAQALHWFDHGAFYDEVRRVSAPGAAIVAWTYGSPEMDGETGTALLEFMYGRLGPYWAPERQLVVDEYRTIPFPFARIEAPRLVLEERWTPSQVAGYGRSWSATSRYVKQHGDDPIPELERVLAHLWPNPAERRSIRWPLVVVAGRVG